MYKRQVYNGIPHLLIPVVTDPKKAAGALNWAVAEMMDRYNKFAASNVRDLKGYNAKVQTLAESGDIPADQIPKKLPQLVIIIDELADLMMVASNEVEDAICRLAPVSYTHLRRHKRGKSTWLEPGNKKKRQNNHRRPRERDHHQQRRQQEDPHRRLKIRQQKIRQDPRQRRESRNRSTRRTLDFYNPKR